VPGCEANTSGTQRCYSVGIAIRQPDGGRSPTKVNTAGTQRFYSVGIAIRQPDGGRPTKVNTAALQPVCANHLLNQHNQGINCTKESVIVIFCGFMTVKVRLWSSGSGVLKLISWHTTVHNLTHSFYHQ
jgi:hypothetical protein